MSKKKKTPPPAPESLGLPCVGVDTHAHLDMDPFDQDLDKVLARARDSGVSHIGNVFLGPDAYGSGRDRFQGHEGVFFILGIHPHDAKLFNDERGARMADAFQVDPKLKALGEIGLDYHYEFSPREVQQQVFRDQLALAREMDVPAVVHSREAESDTLSMLLDMGFADRPLMWHCFGGGPDLVREVLSHGWHVSIPGPVSFPRNDLLREAVARVPADRLVLETDCPYLTAVPYRGKRNEPAYLVFTAKAVARARGEELEQVWRSCGDTARAFFGLE